MMSPRILDHRIRRRWSRSPRSDYMAASPPTPDGNGDATDSPFGLPSSQSGDGVMGEAIDGANSPARGPRPNEGTGQPKLPKLTGADDGSLSPQSNSIMSPPPPTAMYLLGPAAADPFPGHTISPDGAQAHQTWAETLPRDSDPAKTAGFLKNVIAWNGDQGRGDVADLLGRFQAIDPQKAIALQDELHRQAGERIPFRIAPVGTGVQDPTEADPAQAPPQIDLDKAAAKLNEQAQATSQHKCGKYVKSALRTGGVVVGEGVESAKDMGPALEKAQFDPTDKAGYTPQKGDVVVIQPYPGGDPNGHIAMYDGKQWISDFKQKDMWGGPGYCSNQPPYQVYRRKP